MTPQLMRSINFSFFLGRSINFLDLNGETRQVKWTWPNSIPRIQAQRTLRNQTSEGAAVCCRQTGGPGPTKESKAQAFHPIHIHAAETRRTQRNRAEQRSDGRSSKSVRPRPAPGHLLSPPELFRRLSLSPPSSSSAHRRGKEGRGREKKKGASFLPSAGGRPRDYGSAGLRAPDAAEVSCLDPWPPAHVETVLVLVPVSPPCFLAGLAVSSFSSGGLLLHPAEGMAGRPR